MMTDRCYRGLLLAMIVFPLLAHPAGAMNPAIHSALHLLESSAGAPLGKLNVPAGVMASRCTTMVSPQYPQTGDDSPTPTSVTVRVVIWKTGAVSPMRVVFGPPNLEAEAMRVVRLWQYKPYVRDGEPLDVTTDIRVDFDPATTAGLVTHPNH
jgi:TonB family protein